MYSNCSNIYYLYRHTIFVYFPTNTEPLILMLRKQASENMMSIYFSDEIQRILDQSLMDCCKNDKFPPNFKNNCICSFCKEPMGAYHSYRCKKCIDLKVISTPLKDTQSSTKETPKTTTKRINLVPKILVTPIKITKRTINIMPLVVVKKLDIPSAILNPYGMVNDKQRTRTTDTRVKKKKAKVLFQWM